MMSEFFSDVVIGTSDLGCDIEKALDALGPSQRDQKSALFCQVFPSIEAAMARKVTQKSILRELRNFGLTLHPARFKELLDAERARRSRDGEQCLCTHCGSPMSQRAEVNSVQIPGRVDE